jgi:hypothetical protein
MFWGSKWHADKGSPSQFGGNENKACKWVLGEGRRGGGGGVVARGKREPIRWRTIWTRVGVIFRCATLIMANSLCLATSSFSTNPYYTLIKDNYVDSPHVNMKPCYISWFGWKYSLALVPCAFLFSLLALATKARILCLDSLNSIAA